MEPFQDSVDRMWKRGEFFSSAAPVYIARAPGRLDLMGGNDDYTGGLVFESTIREATWAAVQLRTDNRVTLRNETACRAGWQGDVECGLDELVDEPATRAWVNRSPEVRWTAYVLGVFHYLQKRYPDQIRNRGLCVYIDSDVPLNKGVSSSAAVEVAVMKASAAAYGILLAGIDLAQACQWVENVIAESACGIMDQIAVVLGDEGHVLPLVCQPCSPEPLVRLPDAIECWAIDSGVSHAVTGVEYESARAAAFMGYRMICGREGLRINLDETGAVPRYTDRRWNGYLANVPRSLFHERFENALPESLTGAEYQNAWGDHADPFTKVKPEVVYRVRANTRYAVEENQRVQLFSELSRGAELGGFERTFALMGELMFQSHHAYTECGLGHEATDLLVNLAREEGAARGVYGAKVTGGGAGGTVAILGRKDARAALRRIVDRYGEARSFAPYVFEGSSPGADKFGVKILREGTGAENMGRTRPT